MNSTLVKRSLGDNLVNALLSLYIALSIFLPPLFPKKIVFVLILIVSFFYCLSNKKVKIIIINPLIIFIFFLLYTCIGYGAQNESLALQFLFLTSSYFIIYVVTGSNYSVEDNLKKISVSLSLLIIYMSLGYFSEFFSITIPFSSSLTAFFIDNNLGFVGFREFGSFKPPMLHFVSAPILMITLLLIFDSFFTQTNQYRVLPFLIVLLAILLSGSRGIVLFSLLGIVIIYFYRVEWRIKFASLFIVIFVLLIILANMDANITAFSLTEKSNSVKVGHFLSFMQQVSGEQLLVGDGLASLYYSMGFGKVTAQTEVFLLDSLRYFGIFGTLLFFCVLLLPMKLHSNMKIGIISKSRKHSVLYLIFFLYLLMSFTNPILLNSYGSIVVLWFWSRVLSKEEIA